MKSLLPLFITFSGLFVSCKNATEKKENLLKENFYDSIENDNLTFLDSTNLKQYNDSAKWCLYTIYCDDTIKRDNEYLSLGTLPLKLSYVRKNNDTLDLLYKFMITDSTFISTTLTGKYIADGVRFQTTLNKISGLIMGEGIVWESGPKSRFENPLQPEVISYLRENKSKLNLWFKEEAEKKGILH